MLTQVIEALPLTLLLGLLSFILALAFKPIQRTFKDSYKMFVSMFKAISNIAPAIGVFLLLSFAAMGLQNLASKPETTQAINTIEKTTSQVGKTLGTSAKATRSGIASVPWSNIFVFGGIIVMVYLIAKQNNGKDLPNPFSQKKGN